MFDFKCYLCGNDSYKQRQGYTRDNEHLVPLECTKCGLVQLSSFDISLNVFMKTRTCMIIYLFHLKPSYNALKKIQIAAWHNSRVI